MVVRRQIGCGDHFRGARNGRIDITRMREQTAGRVLRITGGKFGKVAESGVQVLLVRAKPAQCDHSTFNACAAAMACSSRRADNTNQVIDANDFDETGNPRDGLFIDMHDRRPMRRRTQHTAVQHAVDLEVLNIGKCAEDPCRECPSGGATAPTIL